MLSFLIAVFLNIATPTTIAQFQPCVWPNRCAKTEIVIKFEPCVWPNRCSVTESANS